MKDVNKQLVIEKLATMLKEVAIPPSWAEFVKTGHGKQRPPVRTDWWQVRTASVLMSIEKLGPVGVSKLTVKYGTKKNRGYKPEKATKGSGSVIRKILQQLESAKLVEQAVKGAHKGRVLTTAGKKMIVQASKEVKKEMPAKEEIRQKPKAEKKPEVKEEKSKTEKPVEKPKTETKNSAKAEKKVN